MSRQEASVLFDAPGPRARLRHNILTAVAVVVLLAVAYVVYARLDERGQFAGELWKPFVEPQVWENLILPGLKNTLGAAAVASVLALLFGVVFGLARLSDHWWIRVPAGAVVEFFRAMPLLILIFLAFFVPPAISPIIADGPFGNAQRIIVENVLFVFGVEINAGNVTVPAFAALVFGLVMYNGSVLAEVVRAGVLAVPRGQSEAAYALGLRKSGVMRLVLLPQAVTAMLPAVVSQLVVLLKDTALGFIIAFQDLLSAGFRIVPANYHNLVPAAIIVSVIYIGMNMALSRFATWLEGRSRRSRKTAAATLGTGTGTPAAAGMGQAAGAGKSEMATGGD
ncbi:amino acid ABC transporter permease [Thermomonospora cellulosilytica]|uniref:Glutamate transport system permease protein n=1 Tax=Thermomonospora cellulosilytica TaxID=1411118 RepID=A0A7W3RC54_9ACTN|nr:amino acid ABC transporter permease [Thermomonospora cellulosilytica]MBA9006945.1 glutamate transport system permease protein [Thermomonospora cellulosilytica]